MKIDSNVITGGFWKGLTGVNTAGTEVIGQGEGEIGVSG